MRVYVLAVEDFEGARELNVQVFKSRTSALKAFCVAVADRVERRDTGLDEDLVVDTTGAVLSGEYTAYVSDPRSPLSEVTLSEVELQE